ncbi:MAG: Nramp family divalent metal transporter [Planctomyces sp.]|nr:Nramp family divalent metal transporter [Planctomyces sp.]
MMKPPAGDAHSPSEADSSGQPATLHIGAPAMPPWNVDELPPPPRLSWRHAFALIGPSIIAGGAAIGGGEWLMGPAVTARYGAALMWLATISILGQMVYNIEISRYTLYSGEPIMNGKFRTLPGPAVWLWLYVLVDFAAIFPYLASNAATPLAVIFLQRMPDSSNPDDQWTIRLLGYAVFLICFLPMLFGGKVYRSLRALMTFKIIVVLGFLLVLALFYSSASTWKDILTGFVQFGTIPTRAAEDRNGNGVLDPDETDWDGDGHPDVIEPALVFIKDSTGAVRGIDVAGNGQPDAFVTISVGPDGQTSTWPDLDGDGLPDPVVEVRGQKGESVTVRLPEGDAPGPRFVLKGPASGFVDVDGDGVRDGDSVVNVFASIARGDGIPPIDLSMIALLAAFAAIAGNGGLTNTPISNFTRDQGWGMGSHVGAIPSMVGGMNVELSHVGSVFIPDEKSLPRWKGWLRHVRRDQMCVWMPACFVGVALPSMLSLVFLRRGTEADEWTAATMTSQKVYDAVLADAPRLAGFCWFMTLFCGCLVLSTAMAAMIDGFVRRWVDVFWTGSPRLRKLETDKIKYVYFAVLCAYCACGLVMLSMAKPLTLVKLATNVMNFALGISCFHTIYVNNSLLPRALRPGLLISVLLGLAGVFFLILAVLALLQMLGAI